MNGFTEVSTQGWLSRLGGSIKGIFFGVIFLIMAFPLLTWNEGRAVKRIKTLEEGSGTVIHIESSTIDPQYNQKLVHLTANVTTDETLIDPLFKVEANAIKLKRKVQMYQWKEDSKKTTEKKIGGGEKTTTEYSYRKVWSSRLIDSDKFKDSEYKNPKDATIKSLTLQAKDISFGAFQFPEKLTRKLNDFQKMELNPDNINTNQTENIIVNDGGYYMGDDPTNPVIGDLKINFETIDPAIVSIVAEQISNTFQPYLTQAGEDILLLENGTVSQDAMFQTALEHNTILTWVLRFVGFLLMFFGLKLMLKTFSVIADVLPIAGDIVEAGTTFISFLIAIILTALIIAFAWLLFRPLIGGGLIVASLAVIWIVKGRIKK